MKLGTIYIISWFGKDTELRAKRKEIHRKQVEWAATHNLHPVIYAQGYAPEDFLAGPTYIVNEDSEHILHPGPARNVLLRHFYASDDDYAVFADNDSLLYEGEKYGNTNYFFEKMKSLDITQLSDVDIIGVTDPCKSPFREETEKSIYDEHLVFKRSTQLKGSMILVKNLKKFYDKELFFDEENFSIDGKMIVGEELCFAIDAMLDGLGCFTTFNAILKELAHTSSTWASTKEDRDILVTKKIINRKHKQDIFKITESTAWSALFEGAEEPTKTRASFDWKKFEHNPKLHKMIMVKYNL